MGQRNLEFGGCCGNFYIIIAGINQEQPQADNKHRQRLDINRIINPYVLSASYRLICPTIPSANPVFYSDDFICRSCSIRTDAPRQYQYSQQLTNRINAGRGAATFQSLQRRHKATTVISNPLAARAKVLTSSHRVHCFQGFAVTFCCPDRTLQCLSSRATYITSSHPLSQYPTYLITTANTSS